MLFLIVPAIVALLILWTLRRPKPWRLSCEFEKMVEDTVAGVGDAGDLAELAKGLDKAKSKHQFRASLVACAKAEFGYTVRSEANRLMVRKFMRDRMREHGMRPAHIVAHVDFCVGCFFIPSDCDIEGKQTTSTRIASVQERLYTGLWESWYGPLGDMLGFKQE
jgi:hypothetical protein